MEEAIEKAVFASKTNGYLLEYLERKEFITMITKILTIEEEIELIKKDEREEGIKEGIQVGKEEEKINMANEMIEENEPIERIVKYTKLPIETVKRLKNTRNR